MKKTKLLIALTGILCAGIFSSHAQQKLPLAGAWHFKIDSTDTGLEEQWYRQTLKDPVKLPGSMQAQGYGNDPSVRTPWIGDKSELFLQQEKYAPYRSDDNYKFPFWLTPVKYYTGPAWYQREVNIPASWKRSAYHLNAGALSLEHYGVCRRSGGGGRQQPGHPACIRPQRPAHAG